MDFRLTARTLARIARMAAAATMKAVARIGDVIVIGTIPFISSFSRPWPRHGAGRQSVSATIVAAPSRFVADDLNVMMTAAARQGKASLTDP
ncbi:hypothetical protein [Mesorhizobium erdmanii]|uniref:hypothetical protein n=1 Tax=Mesorhizobium erdmanii TaxID=1777866 RepID=UPI0012DB5D26|nr:MULTISPECIES: hypothetical protein [Mesorhizobium]